MGCEAPLPHCLRRLPVSAGEAGAAARLQLYPDHLAGLEPLATWEFEADPRPARAVDLDLTRLDVHSAQLATAAGTRVARGFVRSHDDAPPRRLRLELTLTGAPERTVLRTDVTLSAPELDALRRWLRGARVPPIEWFFVELTNYCNLHCPWCPSPARMARGRGFMPLDRIRALWSQIAAYQAAHPRFALYAELRHPIFLHVMGEPLLHPALFEALEEGHRLGLTFCLVTNATLLDERRRARLLDSGLQSVVVSLNAADPATYGLVRPPLARDALVGSIQALIAERLRRGRASPRVEIQLLYADGVALPVQGGLGDRDAIESEVAAWARFVQAAEAAAGWARPVPAAPALLPDAGELEARHPVGENVAVVVKRACTFANALLPEGATLQRAREGRCPADNPSRTLCVLWDGRCTFCSLDYEGEASLGNVFDLGIDAIWSGAHLQRIRDWMERGVAIEPICERCFGMVQRDREAAQSP